MNMKSLGGIMMLLGTCVGAGMLALPIAAANEGFSIATLLLFVAWLSMTFGALTLLEVNLALPEKNNLITMANTTLGPIGKYLTWFVYLLLLYSLLCAYIAGSSNIVFAIMQAMHINSPAWLDTLISVLILSSIVYNGISSVDIVTRGLMSVKFIAYIIIVLAIAPHINTQNLAPHKPIVMHMSTLMVMLTSFGYAIIIPSLRTYYKSCVPQLKKVVLLGSIIPLIIYIIWIAVIQGLIPIGGGHGLNHIGHAQQTNAELMSSIGFYIHKPWVSVISNIFISICAITSLLGVSLCLTDFIADGYKLDKSKKSHNRLIYLITFAPPTIIVLFAPGIFIKALGYAGICCVLLLIILPVLMSISRKYIIKLKSSYIAPGGIILRIIALIFAIAILITLITQKI